MAAALGAVNPSTGIGAVPGFLRSSGRGGRTSAPSSMGSSS